jgi:hypothetical protein
MQRFDWAAQPKFEGRGVHTERLTGRRNRPILCVPDHASARRDLNAHASRCGRITDAGATLRAARPRGAFCIHSQRAPCPLPTSNRAIAGSAEFNLDLKLNARLDLILN